MPIQKSIVVFISNMSVRGGYAEFTVSDRKTGDSAVYKEQLTMEIVKSWLRERRNSVMERFRTVCRRKRLVSVLYIMHYGVDSR